MICSGYLSIINPSTYKYLSVYSFKHSQKNIYSKTNTIRNRQIHKHKERERERERYRSLPKETCLSAMPVTTTPPAPEYCRARETGAVAPPGNTRSHHPRMLAYFWPPLIVCAPDRVGNGKNKKPARAHPQPIDQSINRPVVASLLTSVDLSLPLLLLLPIRSGI